MSANRVFLQNVTGPVLNNMLMSSIADLSITVFFPKMSLSETYVTSFFSPFPRLQSDQVKCEGSLLLLQSFGHSLHSRERLIQVGETMRADRTQSCKQCWNPRPAAVLRLIGMLFVSKGTARPLKWQFSRLYLCVLS